LRVLSFALKIATHSNGLLFDSEPHQIQDLFIKFAVVRAVGIQMKKRAKSTTLPRVVSVGVHCNCKHEARRGAVHAAGLNTIKHTLMNASAPATPHMHTSLPATFRRATDS
jgi:hypothetical protein